MTKSLSFRNKIRAAEMWPGRNRTADTWSFSPCFSRGNQHQKYCSHDACI